MDNLEIIKINLISFNFRLSKNKIEDHISFSKCPLNIKKLINFLIFMTIA